MTRQVATRQDQNFKSGEMMKTDVQQVERTAGLLSFETTRAYNRLKDGKPGDKVTRGEMTRVVGRDCTSTGDGYSNVRSAINRVQNEFGICWVWSRDAQAWVCQDDTGKLVTSRRHLSSAGRKIRKGLRVVATVDPANLSAEDRKDYVLTSTVASTLDLFSGAGFRKKLDKTGAVQFTQPDTQKVLELMNSGTT
jgi:hypothetical protein